MKTPNIIPSKDDGLDEANCKAREFEAKSILRDRLKAEVIIDFFAAQTRAFSTVKLYTSSYC